MLAIKYNDTLEASQDNCFKCSQKLCCTVFSIVDELYQGRKVVEIKSAGKKCNHIGDDGRCGIYSERGRYVGYSRACAQYSCYNVGPIIDRWIQDRQIDIVANSNGISILLKLCSNFIKNNGAHSDNYKLLENIINSYSSIDELIQFILESGQNLGYYWRISTKKDAKGSLE